MLRDRFSRDLLGGYGYLAPVAALVAAFVLVPVGGALVSSLYRDVTFLPKAFVGLSNYAALLRDPAFLQAARFTFLFALVSVPVELLLGTAVALALHRPSRARGALRALALVPWAIPAAVSGRIFELIYDSQVGVASAVAMRVGVADAPAEWLGTPARAFAALVAADAWKTTPFVAILVLAGLSAIPEELHRQAAVDGAGYLGRFRRVTLPLLRPVLVVALLFRTIDALRIFDLIFVLTGGGPGGSTTSLSLYGFSYFAGGDAGYGSTVSAVLFLAALALSVAYLRAGRFTRELS